MSRPIRTRTRLRVLTAAALLVPLAACSSSGDAESKPSSKTPGFPYTVTNCGVKTTYEEPPKRAVTMNQHATEVMLELGLKDRIAGTAYLDDKVLSKYAKAYADTPVLAKEYPSYEKLLAANPDFVYGGYASAFQAGEGRSRGALAKSGVESRLNVEGCAKRAVSMDDVYKEVREVGSTFGVRPRADKWVGAAKRELAETEARSRSKSKKPVPAFVYDSGDKTAFTAGGRGIGNDIIERAGGRNVFADLDKAFGDASWESVVDRNPEVIVILDYGGTTVAQKKKRLLDDPVLANVPAIKHKRFAVLPLSDAVVGVRAPGAVKKLADQL
ncbi:ABC transporter substrate-binding protein [Streptomyces rectiviolaceus]|uniref:ABC transporter substrate-binding protein n=1 Tax=Streptomyces rectiviolaceus TaxID=332591 RepID=A0ABP6MZJ3_9ACTN